jgi:hypothetical protein
MLKVKIKTPQPQGLCQKDFGCKPGAVYATLGKISICPGKNGFYGPDIHRSGLPDLFTPEEKPRVWTKSCPDANFSATPQVDDCLFKH